MTVVDVARHAGVSPMTISRTISEPGKVAKSTRDRVMSSIKAMGYLPNSRPEHCDPVEV